MADRFGLAAYASDGISTCMSLMHPWANRLSGWTYTACGTTVRLPVSRRLHTDLSGLPVNGVHSCDRWKLASAVAGRDSAELGATLRFDSDPAQLTLFPFPHRLQLSSVLSGRVLDLAFDLDASGGRPVPVCFGYRMYLRRARPGGMTLVVPARQSLVTDPWLLPLGEVEPQEMAAYSLDVDELQQVFRLGRDRRITIAAPERRITIDLLGGFPLVHVRSVPREPYVVIEALTAAPDALNNGSFAVATPGEPYRAALRVSASSRGCARGCGCSPTPRRGR